MRAAVDAGAEHLRRLRVPEHATVGRAHDHAVLHHLERVNGRMRHHGPVAVDVALERGDGVRDEVGRDERAGAVVQDDVVVIVRHVFQARERGFLTARPRRRHHDGRDERERVDGALKVLVAALLGAHDDDEADVAHRIERLGRPGEDGLARDLNELLAAFLAEALPRAPGQDDGRRLRIFVHLALEADERLRKRVDVEVVARQLGRAQHLGREHGVDCLGHKAFLSALRIPSPPVCVATGSDDSMRCPQASPAAHHAAPAARSIGERRRLRARPHARQPSHARPADAR